MPRGGKRTGSGRPKGARTKVSAARKAEIIASGEDPLTYMLGVMHDPNAAPARRDDMAKAAAPYIHSRLAAIEHSGAVDTVPPERMTDDELARAIAELRRKLNVAATGTRALPPPDSIELN